MHLHLLNASVASEKAAAIRPASIYFVPTLSRARGASISMWPGGKVSKLGRDCACRLACVCSEEELLISDTTSVSQHLDWQLPAVSRLLSTTGPPPSNFCIIAPIFTGNKEMGTVVSMLQNCCMRCKSALAIADRDVTQDSHNELAERLANLELLTRRYHLQPSGLCCRPHR